MKIKPNLKNEEERNEEQKKIEYVTYRIAIIISAVSVYYFFIKILFL
ncbi:hypothetical protein [Pedobacter immunditicola]